MKIVSLRRVKVNSTSRPLPGLEGQDLPRLEGELIPRASTPVEKVRGSGRYILPRVIRLRDAPAYLGTNKNFFNAEIRPYLTEIPIGAQGVAFDRLDLDKWFDDYEAGNGRPGKAMKGGLSWDRKSRPDSTSVETRGTSVRSSRVTEFEKAVELAISRKRKGI